jgi:aspartate aminotransferase
MVYSGDELEAIARVIEKHEGLFVMTDEIYEHILFSGEHVSLASFDFIYDRVITVNGISKSYAMTGWRLGYIGAPLWIAKACDKLQSQFTSGVCTIAQKAAVAALTRDDGSRKMMRDAFLRRRDLICNLLRGIEGIKFRIPEGAFYIMPDISFYLGKTDGEKTINTADELAIYLLEKAQVAVVGGDAFGAPKCIRLSYATSDELLIEAVKRIKETLEKLK